ncbi:MAG: hypothetical protein AAF804_20420 [Bacteroidota bacterium]
MNLDDLKSNFSQEEVEPQSLANLGRMLDPGQHPSLKGVRRQLLLESLAWTLFLALYHDFFDGQQKPLVWNLLLILAVIGLLMHNLLGYRITSRPVQGEDLRSSLGHYLSKIRRYAWVSIGARVLAILILFGFFLSSVDFEARHYAGAAGIVGLLLVQGFLLWRVWRRRIEVIAEQVGQFN